jgi:hypothetical protein
MALPNGRRGYPDSGQDTGLLAAVVCQTDSLSGTSGCGPNGRIYLTSRKPIPMPLYFLHKVVDIRGVPLDGTNFFVIKSNTNVNFYYPTYQQGQDPSLSIIEKDMRPWLFGYNAHGVFLKWLSASKMFVSV